MRKEVLEYFKKYGGTVEQFISMVERKAVFALRGNLVMANGKLRDGIYMDEMNSVAQDMACDRLLIK